MQTLLELAGYTGYQATCLSPFLWALLALAAVSWIVGCWCDAARRRARRRHIRQREVHRHETR